MCLSLFFDVLNVFLGPLEVTFRLWVLSSVVFQDRTS